MAPAPLATPGKRRETIERPAERHADRWEPKQPRQTLWAPRLRNMGQMLRALHRRGQALEPHTPKDSTGATSNHA
eukprot:CAMPEP_0198538492 /NCGR_PEP_ID=MMETSP1462-20131121/47902_1 /TAXON_ID=1333877 /ORGANISM="Brandtodinium nutriculum, Strain RCC3387" /LENGTH=74 /DNA_ID=CAMNT_0044268517 /DNA_START=107 /DNA_END=328 /DNA_ORIENTATION=+